MFESPLKSFVDETLIIQAKKRVLFSKCKKKTYLSTIVLNVMFCRKKVGQIFPLLSEPFSTKD